MQRRRARDFWGGVRPIKRALFSMAGILLGAMCSMFAPAHAESNRPVPPPDSALFTHAPTDIANTTGVIPPIAPLVELAPLRLALHGHYVEDQDKRIGSRRPIQQ